mmetsp:Transcript_155771/g.499350  ORF Transcript_155771/g.499350 Transcript_155771/m.499350 type:complete len:648 (+) Transcript_155771:198-2141(+)
MPPGEAFERFDELLRRRPPPPDARPGAACTQLPPVLPRRQSAGHDEQALPPPGHDWASAEDQEQLGDDDVGDAMKALSDDLETWSGDLKALCKDALELEQECRLDLAKPRLMATAQQESLFAEIRLLDEEGDRWREGVWGGLGRLRKRVATLAQNAEQCSVNQLQAIGRGIEREVEVFKAQQRQEFQTLAASELGLHEESLHALGRRAEGWVADPSALLPPQSARSRGSSTPPPDSGQDSDDLGSAHSSRRLLRMPSADGLPAVPRPGTAQAHEDEGVKEIRLEIVEVDAELACMGSETGGWSTFEHKLFLRIFTAGGLKAGPALLAKLGAKLPTPRREEELLEHVRWTGDYEALQAKRRNLLTRWRDKRVELELKAEAAGLALKAQQAELRRQAELQKQKEQGERRSQVAEWRQARAERERQVAIEQELAEQAQLRRGREAQMNKCMAQKEVVDEWRGQLEAAQAHAARQEVAARANTRRISHQEKRRIAQRNAEMLRKRMQEMPPEMMEPQRPPRRPASARSSRRLGCSNSADCCGPVDSLGQVPGSPSCGSRVRASSTHVEGSRLHQMTRSTAAKVSVKASEAAMPLSPKASQCVELPPEAAPAKPPAGASHLARVLRAASAGPPAGAGRLARPPSAPPAVASH